MLQAIEGVGKWRKESSEGRGALQMHAQGKMSTRVQRDVLFHSDNFQAARVLGKWEKSDP